MESARKRRQRFHSVVVNAEADTALDGEQRKGAHPPHVRLHWPCHKPPQGVPQRSQHLFPLHEADPNTRRFPTRSTPHAQTHTRNDQHHKQQRRVTKATVDALGSTTAAALESDSGVLGRCKREIPVPPSPGHAPSTRRRWLAKSPSHTCASPLFDFSFFFPSRSSPGLTGFI